MQCTFWHIDSEKAKWREDQYDCKSRLILLCVQAYEEQKQKSYWTAYPKSFLFVLQAPGYGDIKVTVEKVADTVPLETNFDICLKITNCW